MATYLIDYENVSKDGLNGVTRLTEKDRVIIFYSEKADRMTFGLHRRLNETKAAVEYKKVEVGGHNALDFQLATYLGFLLAKDSTEEYCVVSNDRGFEYLTGFWRKPLYDVTLTRTISESPQAEERRQARRNGRSGSGTGTDVNDPAAGDTAGQEAQAEDGTAENTAVVAVEKNPLVVVPGAEDRQLDIVREKPLKAKPPKKKAAAGTDNASRAENRGEAAGGTVPAAEAAQSADTAVKSAEAVAQSPETAAQSAEAAVQDAPGTVPEEVAARSADAAAQDADREESAAFDAAEGENAGEPDAQEDKPKSSRRRRSRRGSRSKAKQNGQTEEPEEASAAESGDPEKAESASSEKAESGKAETGSGQKTDSEQDVTSAPAKRRRASRSRKRVTIPYLADVKKLVGGNGLNDKDLKEIAGFVERYKTKQGVNNALVRKFGNQKGGELYQGIKPLLKDKKGHVTQKAPQA